MGLLSGNTENQKKEIIEQDEFELGNRKLLNFGHTLGHAIETFYNYDKYTHGQAVAIGMAYIIKSCEKLSICSTKIYDDLIFTLKKYKLPYKINCNINSLIELAKTDKKATNDYLDIILISDIGKSFIKRISKNDLKKYIGG